MILQLFALRFMSFPWWMPMMAQAAQATPPAPDPLDKLLPWITAFVVAVIGAVGASLAHKSGKASRVQIDPLPLPVKMEDHFVTRREFEKLETTVLIGATKMEQLFTRAVEKIEERDERLSLRIDDRDERLTSKIEGVANTAYQGRQKIHIKVNDYGERLKSLEDRNPVKGRTTH